MVKAGIPKSDDFMQQYGGGVHQHGSKGASPLSDQNAEEFQKHMQGLEAQNAQVPKLAPHELMSPTGPQNLGAPEVHPMQAPAPENFGPPQISKVDTDNKLDFGAPGSHSFKNVAQNFGPPTGTANSSSHQVASDQAKTLQQAHPANLGSTPGGGKGGHGVGDGKGGKGEAPAKKETYQQVEQLEINNMLQNAMNHMKISDPDPDAWN